MHRQYFIWRIYKTRKLFRTFRHWTWLFFGVNFFFLLCKSTTLRSRFIMCARAEKAKKKHSTITETHTRSVLWVQTRGTTTEETILSYKIFLFVYEWRLILFRSVYDRHSTRLVGATCHGRFKDSTPTQPGDEAVFINNLLVRLCV